MEYKEKVKYLDIVIKGIKNTDMFDIYTVLTKEVEIESNLASEYCEYLKSFGIKNKLFELNSSFLKLTPKGDELKLFKKGFEKFKESLDEKNNLEIENLKLQNEAIGYSKKIRAQKQRIRNLDEALKTYDFVKKYWYVVFIFLSIIYKSLELFLVYIYNSIQ
jgi:hypothetical protein